MDIDTIRSLVTALAFLCFLAIAFWAYSKGAQKRFQEAAMIPFSDDENAPLNDAPLNNKE